MIRIPGGTFWMGSAEGEGESYEHPTHRVSLSPYCIDRTEVTVGSYRQCVAQGGCAPPAPTVNVASWDAPTVTFTNNFCNWSRSGVETHPMNCVDWDQSDAFCRWIGGRLPTEAEWEYAARGADGRQYPWGNDAPGPTLLNGIGGETNAYVTQFGRTYNELMYPGNDGWPTTAPVGSYPSGASPFGILDTAGNVYEWTADWYGTYSADSQSNPQGANSGNERVFRGGGWSEGRASSVRAAHRVSNTRALRNATLGFRCSRGTR